jgi:hypothetical protein
VLCGLCWCVETAFLDLKYAVHVEEFVSRKENLIKKSFLFRCFIGEFVYVVCGCG